MAFERAKIVIKPASVGTGLKVTLTKFKASAASMKFSVSDALAKSFGWSDGDKLEVLIGTDEHHGIIRLRKNNSAGDAVVAFRKALKGSYAQVSLGNQPMFVDRAESGRWCQFEKIEDDYLEIILPRWADETAPKRKAVITPTPAAVDTAKPQAPRQNATAALMGDPPPGRREMLNKVGSLKA